jgi:hypothetical protein
MVKNDGLRNTVKVIVSSSNKSVNVCFDNVMKDLDNNQYEFNKLVIQPKAGFVIETTNGSNKIFVNVCHSKIVGAGLTITETDCGKYQIDINDFPFIIGAIKEIEGCVDNKSNDNYVEANKTSVLTIDVIIHTSLMVHISLEEHLKDKVN